MTNFDYLLPESDRIAADANGRMQEIADMSADAAGLVEYGATTVITLLRESARDLQNWVIGQALAAGFSREFAIEQFDGVYDGLLDFLTPRLEALRLGTEYAQLAQWEKELLYPEPVEVQPEPVDPEVSAIDDLMESLFASMLGADVAATLRADVEAGRLAVEDDEDDEDDANALTFEEYLNETFNRPSVGGQFI